MSLANELLALSSQVRALEAEIASLRRENRRLRLQQIKVKSGGLAPWSVLGIDRDADKSEVLSAFRSLSKQHHPDTPGGDRDRFEQLVDARDQMLSGLSS